MHFYCNCGNRISDTSDFLSYKGYLLADQDEEDYYDAIEQEIKNEKITKDECVSNIVINLGVDYLGRALYQCKDCGRLFIEDESGENFYTFVPEGEINKHVLNSKEGENWKGFLFAEWYDEKPSWMDYNGYIEIMINKSFEKENLCFTNKEAFQKAYYELFERLKEEGIIRSSIMKMNKEWIHNWNLKKSGETK